MDQEKPYFGGETPKRPNRTPESGIDAVALRKALGESLTPILTAIPSEIATAVAKGMEKYPTPTVYTMDPDKMAESISQSIGKLQQPNVTVDVPDVVRLHPETVKALANNEDLEKSVEKLATAVSMIKKDDGSGIRAIAEEMMKNPKLWFNFRLVDGKTFLDKMSETIMVGMGGANVAKDATLRAIQALLTQPLTTSGLQTVAAQTTVLLDQDTTLLEANASYTGPWTRVMGRYGALNLASFINVSGFGGSTRYAVVSVEFSSDGVTFDGTFVSLAVGYSDANPSNVAVDILDNYARLKITASGSDNYDWSAAGGAPRTTLVGVPAGNGSFVRTVGTTVVIGDQDPAQLPVQVGGVSTSNPTSAPIPIGITENGAGQGQVQVVGTNSVITGLAVVTAEKGGATGTLSNVTEATSSTQLAALSTSRRGFIVFNDTANVLTLKFGTTVSATSLTVKVAAGASWQMPLALYTGAITGISTGTGGVWRVTTW